MADLAAGAVALEDGRAGLAGEPWAGDAHVRLDLTEVVPAPGVTHLRYEVVR